MLSEVHRHPKGPWLLFVEKLTSLNLPPNSIVVDLASGPGEPAVTLSAAFPSLTFISTDISVDMHKAAAKKAILQQNLKAMIADMSDLSAFADNSVDCITVCYGYMFPQDKAKALEESFRVLKPGGSVITTHWIKLNFLQIVREILEGVLDLEPGKAPPLGIDPLSLSEPGLFDALASAAGFSITESSQTEYPFLLGDDPEVHYKLATMMIRPKLDELNAHEKARELALTLLDKYGRLEGDQLHIAGNVFNMTVATKPSSVARLE